MAAAQGALAHLMWRLASLSLAAIAAVSALASPSCEGGGYLNSRLCEAWSAKQSAGIIAKVASRHLSPGHLQTRKLGERFGVIAQFAPQRALAENGKESVASTDSEPFFFDSVHEDEVLLCFNPKPEGPCQHTAAKNTCVMPAFVSARPPGFEKCDLNSTEPAVVLLHNRPVCAGHAIVVPDLRKRLPQIMSEDYLVLGFAFAFRASPRSWLSFSTLGVGAGADHLHWEAFFAVPSQNDALPFQAHIDGGGATLAAVPRGPISLMVTPSWPVRGWIFTWGDREILEVDTALAEWRMAEFLNAFLSRLQGKGIDYHLFIHAGGARATIFPRRAQAPGGAAASRWKVSAQEVLGWWPLAQENDYDALDEESALNSLRAVALTAKNERAVVQALRDSGWELRDTALERTNARSERSVTDAAPDRKSVV